jgi:DNA mismatch repair protein MutL
LLPDHIANQIAAGEVIQRPASVVKELMENAVDAGAVNIAVNIKDAGRTLVQVIDDGKGMSETDARMAFERHATSKISTAEDLFTLGTMGFRGEALASIAAVAQVELRTRVKGSEVGFSLSIAGSALEDATPAACSEGSVFSVKNLFYNVPARRKFLKSNDAEFRHILTEFERVALVNPAVAFALRHNDATVFDLPASNVRQRISDVFGKSMDRKLLTVDTETSLVAVHGFVSCLEAVRKRGALQYFFVNGRYIRHPYFHRALMQAYEQMIPAGDMPDYFIYFTLDPASIDVNIHPTKTEIKFENEHAVWQIFHSAVRETLAKSNSVPSIDFEGAGLIEMPVFTPSADNSFNVRNPPLTVNPDFNPFKSQPPLLEDLGKARRPTDNWEALYQGFEKEKTSTDDLTDKALFAEVTNTCFQYKNRFIITMLKSGLVIIDQHRAHVRTLYERYMRNINRQCAASQTLLFPEIVELTAAEASILTTMADEMRYLGFDIGCMGGGSYAVHAVPADATGSNPSALVKDALAAATESGVGGVELQIEKIALSLAKTTAIRSGKTLTPEEMDSLVASLFSLDSHGLTPDGLPVLTVLSDEEISRKLSL